MRFYVKWSDGTEDVIEADDYSDAESIANYQMTNDLAVKAVTIRQVAGSERHCQVVHWRGEPCECFA